MMNELPQLESVAYGTQNMMASYGGSMVCGEADEEAHDFVPASLHRRVSNALGPAFHVFQQNQTIEPIMNQKRIVQVFIADPDKRVPVEESLLYRGDQKLTDLTDQELFFDIDVKGSLETHNAKRIKMIDKEATQKSGKEVFLDAVKIRDLKMTVVSIATF